MALSINFFLLFQFKKYLSICLKINMEDNDDINGLIFMYSLCDRFHLIVMASVS